MVGYTGSTSVTQWELHLFYIWILSTIFEVAWACDVFGMWLILLNFKSISHISWWYLMAGPCMKM